MTVRQVPAIILAVAVIGCSQSEQSSQPEPKARALPVEVLRVRLVDSYDESRAYAGTVTARQVSELAFQRVGEVTDLLVDDGMKVNKGQVLARLDTRALAQQKARLVASRNQAQAVLDELRAGPRQERIDAATATLADLQAQLALAAKSLQRVTAQRTRGASSPQQLDEATAAVESLESKCEVASRQLAELKTGTRQERVTAQEAAVSQFDASLRELQVQLDDSEIKAPFSGTIAQRFIDPGSTTAPGQAIFTLIETDHLEARVGLPANVAASLSRDHSFSFVWRERNVAGRFRAALPQVEQATRNQTIVFELETSGGAQPVSGDVIRLELDELMNESGFWVPLSSLSRGTKGLWSVLIVLPNGDGDHKISRAVVEVVYTKGDRVLVRGTLKDGDLIVASGSHRVVPGQTVSPIANGTSGRSGPPAAGDPK